MINPDLERRYADCLELVEAWRLFLDIINRALKSPDAVPAQLEQQFLNAKARIAMLHDSFTASLRHDKQIGANMIEIVNRAISLRMLKKVSEAEAKKMEREWHEVFLLLNETVSTLNEERSELANVNEFTFKLGKMRESFMANLKGFLGSFYFKITAAIVGIIFILIGIPALGIYDYDNLRDVKPIRPVVKMYLDATRTGLGLQQAYIDMPDFMTKLTKEPGNRSERVDTKTPEVPRDRGTAIVAGANMFPSQELATALEVAQGYEVVEYTGSGLGAGKARVYLYWFRKGRDAAKADTAARRVTAAGPGVRIVRKGNVLCFVQAQNAEYAGDVIRYGLGRMSPN